MFWGHPESFENDSVNDRYQTLPTCSLPRAGGLLTWPPHFLSWMVPNIQNRAQQQGNPGNCTRWQLTPREKCSLIFSRAFDLRVCIRILFSGLTMIARNIITYSFGCKTKIDVLLKDGDIETCHVGAVGGQKLLKFSVGKAAHTR